MRVALTLDFLREKISSEVLIKLFKGEVQPEDVVSELKNEEFSNLINELVNNLNVKLEKLLKERNLQPNSNIMEGFKRVNKVILSLIMLKLEEVIKNS